MILNLHILIVSAICSVLVFVLLFIQHKGYLKHWFISLVMLIGSILFVIAAAVLCYFEYDNYQQLKGQSSNIAIESLPLSNVDLNRLEEFSEAKNTLLGYEAYLLQNASTFVKENYSYDNLIKEQLISQFEQKEYETEYWQSIIEIAYCTSIDSTSIWSTFPHDIIPVEYKERNISEGQLGGECVGPMDYIKYHSIYEYCERKLKTYNRSNESIANLWEDNKSIFYTLFSNKKYDRLGRIAVDNLIAIHDTIVVSPGYHLFYQQYDQRDSMFLTFPSEEVTAYYNDDWMFGFWDRRFQEGNDETVYGILVEIQKHYKR